MEDYTFTVGSFTELPAGAVEHILGALKIQITQFWSKRYNDFRYSVKYRSKTVIKLGDRPFHVTYVKLSGYGNLSIYLESEKYLIRISDHWSHGSSCRNIGLIRYSEWALKEKDQHIIAFANHNLQGGYIKKKDLKVRSFLS
jgi:hypothetical protein